MAGAINREQSIQLVDVGAAPIGDHDGPKLEFVRRKFEQIRKPVHRGRFHRALEG